MGRPLLLPLKLGRFWRFVAGLLVLFVHATTSEKQLLIKQMWEEEEQGLLLVLAVREQQVLPELQRVVVLWTRVVAGAVRREGTTTTHWIRVQYSARIALRYRCIESFSTFGKSTSKCGILNLLRARRAQL